jgi:hypothetical protein
VCTTQRAGVCATPAGAAATMAAAPPHAKPAWATAKPARPDSGDKHSQVGMSEGGPETAMATAAARTGSGGGIGGRIRVRSSGGVGSRSDNGGGGIRSTGWAMHTNEGRHMVGAGSHHPLHPLPRSNPPFLFFFLLSEYKRV